MKLEENNTQKSGRPNNMALCVYIITDSDKSNPKLYWKILKQLIKSNKNSETIPP